LRGDFRERDEGEKSQQDAARISFKGCVGPHILTPVVRSSDNQEWMGVTKVGKDLNAAVLIQPPARLSPSDSARAKERKVLIIPRG
jgi:hypothetical protein